MTASTCSRSSSLLSLDTSLSSCTTYPPSPISPLASEKIPAASPSRPMVLHWKPILASTAFTQSVSSRLHFTAFPPQDLRKPMFEQLSRDAAQALLLEHMGPSTLSICAQPDSQIKQVSTIPWPSSLPQELVQCLQDNEWGYFSVSGTRIPLGLGKLSTSFDHHVAIRPIRDGVERYIFGPAGLCIHSTCCLHDAGVRAEEKTPRETLYLCENTEVLCHRMLKKWTQSLLTGQIAASHEQFRLEWDMSIRHEWSLVKMRQNIDLLA